MKETGGSGGEVPKPEFESFQSSSQPTAPLYVLTRCCTETGGTAPPTSQTRAPPRQSPHLGGHRTERPRLRPDTRVWRADALHLALFPVIRKKIRIFKRPYFSFFFLAVHTACGILLPGPGMKPAPPAVKAQSLKHRTYQSESEVTQSCPALCDPMDCSLPGSSVHGIFQARVLEWGAIAFFPIYCIS